MAESRSLGIAQLRAAYEAREVTPRAVVRDVLAAVAATRSENPVWIHVMPEDLLAARVSALERELAQGQRLPLYGIPFAVKDNIDVAGAPTTAACPAFSYLPGETAHAVARLEQAGAICIGKTNMDQFATGLVGTRSPYGACRNPFDARYIAGGSSSGSALSVALGHVSFALGTDTAGSGRVPAAFCNLVGFKPTRGLVSAHGVVPACRSLDCVSIFALTSKDAAKVFQIIVGPDPADPYSRQTAPRAVDESGPQFTQKCGVLSPSQLEFFGDDAARRAYERVISRLVSLGIPLRAFDYTPFSEAARLLYEGPWVAERLAAVRPFYETSAGEMHPVIQEILAGATRFTATDAFEAQYRLQALAKKAAAAWQELDFLLLPTAGTIYRVDDVLADPMRLNTNLGYYTNFVNLLDLCALALPAGFREDGLPFGVTLIGRTLDDLELLRWAARYAATLSSRRLT